MGESKNRMGIVDYSKWEKLAAEVSDDDEFGDAACRVTKLEKPGAVVVDKVGYTICGNISSQQGVKGTRDQRAAEQHENSFSQELPTRTRSGESPMKRGLEPEGAIRSDRQSLPNILDERTGDEERAIPKPPQWCRDPDFVSETELLGGTRPPSRRKGEKPTLQEWSPAKKSWDTLEYSKWYGINVSEEASGLSDSNIDDDDLRVVTRIRQDLARVVQSGDEQQLRRTILHAEPMVRMGLMNESELEAGRAALCNMTSARPAKARTVSSDPAEDSDPCAERLDDSATARQKLELMTLNGGRTDHFLWSQTGDLVILYIFVSKEVRGADVAFTVREKYLRLDLHEPQDPKARTFSRILAEDRKLVRTLFETKLAYRVRYADNETEWEVCNICDWDAEGGVVQRRAVRVLLTKMPPGEYFYPAHVPEWHEEYIGPGTWRESIVRVWWERVRRGDPKVDVTTLKGRKGNATASSELFRQAEEMFKQRVGRIKKHDLSQLAVSEIMEEKRNKTEAELEREGVPEGSPDWEERIAWAEADAREAAEKELEAVYEERQRMEEEEEKEEAAWQSEQDLRRERRRQARDARRLAGRDDSASTVSEEFDPVAMFRPTL